MKAIDRAATWTQWLEEVGYDITCETSIDIVRNEYLTVWAVNGNAKVVFTILMNTPRTRFVTGSRGYVRFGDWTRKPSEMSSWVSSEVMMQHYRMKQEVSA